MKPAKRILVVDRDNSVRESLKKVLQAVGYQVSLASDGTEAARQLEQEQIDLALVETDLPDQEGAQLLDFLGQTHPDLPVIVTDMPFATIPSGVGASMEKPIEVPILLHTIQTVLSSPKRLSGSAKSLCHSTSRAALEWTWEKRCA